MQTRTIEKLQKAFRPITGRKHFDTITGVLSLLNPIAILPQLLDAIFKSTEGVSLYTWGIFVVFQTTVALVAVKGRNLGTFISMVISIVLSLSVIAVVLLKT